MTKQEIINALNSSELDPADKEVFLAIIANEGDIISGETQAKIIDAIQDMVKDIASKTEVTLDIINPTEEIDAEFQKEIDDAEKLLSKLDMTERDLDIAYTSTKA